MTCFRRTFALATCLLLILHVTAQDSLKAYPTHWWVGMKQSKIQLLVRAPNIKSARLVVLKPYAGVKLTSVQTHTSANYLTIYLDISKTAAPGNLSFTFNNGATQVAQMSYTLKPRSNQNGKTRIKVVNSSDLIYLI
ncbi:MAG TPA: cyclomaltodextrinase N-terminal domain-containing protein, partial [Niastella sp.]